MCHLVGMALDSDRCWQAVAAGDSRFDGWVFCGVTSTGIYCRPSCPARTPKRANVRFFPTAAAAQGAGFRACKRCRPDATPGSPEWDQRTDLVGRAMRLIADGVVDREGVTPTRRWCSRRSAATRWSAAPFAGVREQLGEFFDGAREHFDVALAPAGAPLHLRVWGELRRIGYGETISYGELARRVGRPSAARAVGLANGRNPISIIVPCHRVIGADGALTGYGGGVEAKRRCSSWSRGCSRCSASLAEPTARAR